MNSELHSILIRQARRNEMIAYGQIMTQFGFSQDQLHKELEAVSRNEFENDRPMLTVMAEYKTGGYGYEFFKLAEEFGHGKADELKATSFAKDMQKKCMNSGEMIVIQLSDRIIYWGLSTESWPIFLY